MIYSQGWSKHFLSLMYLFKIAVSHNFAKNKPVYVQQKSLSLSSQELQECFLQKSRSIAAMRATLILRACDFFLTGKENQEEGEEVCMCAIKIYTAQYGPRSRVKWLFIYWVCFLSEIIVTKLTCSYSTND